MPSAIKAFAVNTTATSTIYTVPTGTVAKVILSSAKVYAAGSSSYFTIGVCYSLGASIASSYATVNVGGTNSTASSTADYPVGPTCEFYLAAGQSVIATVNSTGSGYVKANFGVIEELAS